jgi:hypothetical protein
LVKGISRAATLGMLVAAGGTLLLLFYLAVWLAGAIF